MNPKQIDQRIRKEIKSILDSGDKESDVVQKLLDLFRYEISKASAAQMLKILSTFSQTL